MGTVECEVKYAPFASTKRRSHIPVVGADGISASLLSRFKPFQDNEEREMSRTITAILSATIRLDRYPKLTVELFATVLEDDGSGWEGKGG